MRFSIIITSTRPHLLRYSLRSALSQRFGDYEIVISDNSESGARGLVDGIADPRVRYVRPTERMPLVAHWDFAFSQAVGDWQLQLCDDDAITPNLLVVLDDAIRSNSDIEAICWAQGVYSDDIRWGRLRKTKQLGVNAFTGVATRYDSKRLLAEMFESGTGLFRIKRRIPFFPRAVCRRDVLDGIRSEQGHLFHPFCPMTSGAAAVLSFSKSVLHIDLPLRILGLTTDSCTGWAVDPATMEKSHAGTKVELAPIKQYRVLPTAQADALLRTQRAMPDRLGQYNLNYVNYFIHCHEFLRECETYGLDTTYYWSVFDSALREMPENVHSAVCAEIANMPEEQSPDLYLRVKIAAKSVIDRMRGPRLPGEVDAAQLGLRDIADCADYIGAMIDRQFPAHS